MLALFHNVQSCPVGQIETFGGHIQAPRPYVCFWHTWLGEVKQKTRHKN